MFNGLFSAHRLEAFLDENEHFENFRLIGKIMPLLGMVKVVTRDKVAEISQNEVDDVSNYTLGFWCKKMNDERIHNLVVDFNGLDFGKYSKFNNYKQINKLYNYQKVKFAYSLISTIRNRACHFENLFKLVNGRPRISSGIQIGKDAKGQPNFSVVSVESDKIELFLKDILLCFNKSFEKYFEKF